MVIIRDACRNGDLQIVANVMSSHGYTRNAPIPAAPNDHGPIVSWTEGPHEAADMVFFVSSCVNADHKLALQVTAEGYGRLTGLILLGGTGDIHVEVSDALEATGNLGVDVKDVRRELLMFPGFSSMEQLYKSMGVSQLRFP